METREPLQEWDVGLEHSLVGPGQFSDWVEKESFMVANLRATFKSLAWMFSWESPGACPFPWLRTT